MSTHDNPALGLGERPPLSKVRRRRGKPYYIGGGVVLVVLLGLLAYTLFPSSKSAAPSREHTVPRSIAGNCSTDVSSAITKWIQSVPDGSIINFGRNACYRTDAPLKFEDRNNLTVDGHGAVFRRYNPTPLDPDKPHIVGNPHWAFTGKRDKQGHFSSNSITLRNMRVLGLNTVSGATNGFEANRFGTAGGKLEHEYGYGFSAVNGIKLDNLTADAVFGDGLLLGFECAEKEVQNVEAHNLHFDRTGRHGVAITSAQGVLLDHIGVPHSSYDGIDMESDCATAVIRNVEVENSYFYARLVPIGSYSQGDVSQIYIHDNTFRNASYWPWLEVSHGPKNLRRNHWWVYRNTFLTPHATAQIHFAEADNLDLRNNSSPPVKPVNPKAVPDSAILLVNIGAQISIIGNDYTDAGHELYKATGNADPLLVCNNKIDASGFAPPCPDRLPPMMPGWTGPVAPAAAPTTSPETTTTLGAPAPSDPTTTTP